MKISLNWKPPYGVHSIIGTNIVILIVGRKDRRSNYLLGAALVFLLELSESTSKSCIVIGIINFFIAILYGVLNQEREGNGWDQMDFVGGRFGSWSKTFAPV